MQEHKEKILKLEGLDFHIRNTSIPGSLAIEATFEDHPSPVGTVWFQWVGNETITINESYVPKQFRRCGIRTYLHKKLIESYPTLKELTTGSCTTESRPWLIKQGFKKDSHKDWVLEL